MTYNNQEKVEWVELLEPGSRKVIYANLESGDVRIESPPNAKVRPLGENQWWELFDMNTQRHYYHNAHTSETVWFRPSSGDIIPLSKLQMLKQATNLEGTIEKDIGMMHRQKSSRSDPNTTRNSMLIKQMDQQNTQQHRRPQAHLSSSGTDRNSTPAISRHQIRQLLPEYDEEQPQQRRRNSQPNQTTHNSPAGPQRQQLQPLPQHQSLTRNSLQTAAGMGRNAYALPSAGQVNQRVTEWLRSAGAVPEEEDVDAEFEDQGVGLDRKAKREVLTRAPVTCEIQQRWSRATQENLMNSQPVFTSVQHSSGYMIPPITINPLHTSAAVTYDRRLAAPNPIVSVHSERNHVNNIDDSCASNLLYDIGCNVTVPPTPPRNASMMMIMPNLEHQMSALNMGQRTPQPSSRGRLFPRTNPAFGRTGQTSIFTMPRLSGGVSAKEPALLPIDPASTQMHHRSTQPIGFPLTEKNGNGNGAYSSPDTELTEDSSDADIEENIVADDEDEDEEEVTQKAEDAPPALPSRRGEELFEQHSQFVAVVDEYTFTLDREPPPPTPPPRLASAAGTMMMGFPKYVQENNSGWQNFDSPSGFLPRGHRLRQPTSRSTKQFTEDEVPLNDEVSLQQQQQALHYSSNCNVSTGCQESSGTSMANLVSATPLLNPRRSASGGFIGPADEAHSVPSAGACSTFSSGGGFGNQMQLGFKGEQSAALHLMPASPGATNSSPHFALISGPVSWPKNLLCSGPKDINTFMTWTKSTFTKRLLAATDKGLQKHIPENFKLIQSFMGDRTAKLSKPDLASIIVHRGLTTPGIRDELYAALCKQTTGNYNADSLMRGWELLCICLYFFPPNNIFRNPLRTYLETRCEALSVAEACSGPDSTSPSESGTADRSSSFSSSKQPTSTQAIPRPPGPSLAAAAALAAGSDPALISATTVTPVFGVPLSGSGQSDALSLIGTSKRSLGCTDSIFYVDHSSGTPECQLLNNTSTDFPYGPWMKLSALHFTRVAPRWLARSIAVGPSHIPMPLSNADLLHVKDFLLKPGVFGSSIEEMIKIQFCRFPSLRLPWIQIFLTEELLRLKGDKAEGVFRLSADLDIMTNVRFELEKLFEVFRVVHVLPRDTSERSSSATLSSQSSCESSSGVVGGHYTIFRPPPPNWSKSLIVFSPELSLSREESTNSTINLDCPSLTGAFSLPLKPTPIPEHPLEYMLLTPRSRWPGDLANFDGSADTKNPHLAAALLKLWFREMSMPLIPPSLVPEVFASAIEAEAYETTLTKMAYAPNQSTSVTTPIEACCWLVRRLPKHNRRCLLYLIRLLQHLILPENASASLMDSRNLATVIAPNLFRSSATNPSEMLNSVQSQTAFVRLLIVHLDVNAEAELLNSDGGVEVPLLASRSPPRARINPDGILIPFR